MVDVVAVTGLAICEDESATASCDVTTAGALDIAVVKLVACK